jgi:outer membrane protein assembly factor BamB
VKAAWSFDYPGYFSGGDLAMSVFATDLVVLAKEFEGGAIIAIDPTTGAKRFETTGVAALRGAGGELYVVGVETRSGAFMGTHVVVEVDPLTGDPRRTIALSPPLPSFPSARFAIAGTKLLAIGDGNLEAYDLASGQRLWQVTAESSHLFAPVIQGDRIILSGPIYSAHRLSDGKLLWKHKGECCTALASPDGKHVYIRAGVKAIADLDPEGLVLRTGTGQVAAVSTDWIAITDPTGVTVMRHGSSTPTLRLDAPDADHGFTAIALHGDWLFYFDMRDRKLYLHDVVSDQRVAIHEAHEKFVLSPDATGTAPAFVGDPPIIAPPRIYVLDWQLHAYQVDRDR